MQVPKAVREISRDGTGDGTLTSRTGSSFILQWHHQFNLVQAGGKGWAPGEHVFSYQSFLCFFVLVLLLCRCSVSVYRHVWVTCHWATSISFQLQNLWERPFLPVCQSSFLTLFITVSGVVGIVISSLGGRTPNEAMGCSRFTASGFPG